MPGGREKTGPARRPTIRPANAKKPKTFRLSESRIESARQILGVHTATAAIEAALDMVVFRKELVDGTRSLLGIALNPFDSH